MKACTSCHDFPPGQSLCRLVRKYPSTLVYPVLVLALVLGVGVWGITRLAQADASGSKVTFRNPTTLEPSARQGPRPDPVSRC
jgi:hypothetical protein